LGFYVVADSKDGTKPAETNLIRELISHIDANYRTRASREYRIIQRFSMGGYGACALAVKYPELFRVCVNYDGALHNWKSLSSRRRKIASEIFDNDGDYYNKFSPWYNATQHAEAIRDKVEFRMVIGALSEFNQRYQKHLQGLNIPVDYVQTTCGHNLDCLFKEAGVESFD